MKNIFLKLAAFLTIFSAAVLNAQTTNSQNVGSPLNATSEGSDVESVQANNGNLHIEIPLFTLPGRGLPVKVSYVYDSKGWYGLTQGNGNVFIKPSIPDSVGNSVQQWRIAGPLSNGLGLHWTTSLGPVCGGGGAKDTYITYTYQEPDGTSHSTAKILFQTPCNTPPNYTGNLVYAEDGSGYAIVIPSFGAIPTKVIRKDGTRISCTSTKCLMEDSNGNQIARAVSNNVYSSAVTDTLGRSVSIALTHNPVTGNYELPYTDANGNSQKVVIVMGKAVTMGTSLCGFWQTGDPPCYEYPQPGDPSSWQMPTEIDLPNGLKYTIGYQNSYAMPSYITLPNGARIDYTWGTNSVACTGVGQNFDTDDSGPRVMSRTVTVNGQVSPWNYIYTCEASTFHVSITDQTVVTDPVENDSVHHLIHYLDDANEWGTTVLPRSYEFETDYYLGAWTSHVLLKKVQTTFQAKTVGPHLPTSVTTTWYNTTGNLVSYTETDWDSFVNPVAVNLNLGNDFPNLSWVNPLAKREYVFGVNAHGGLARKTQFNYLHLTNSAYQTLNIADRPTSKVVSDGTNTFAQTTYAYDGESALTQTSGVSNHDYTNYPYTFRTRGNLTKTSVWRNLPLPITWLDTIHNHDDLGNVLSTTDPDGNTTSFAYTDAWSGSTTCTVGNTHAFLTQTSAPDIGTVHHRTQDTYYRCTGQVEATQDENDILASRTGTTYSYDLMLRPSTVNYPDGGQTSYSYTDTSGSVSITSTQTINSGANRVTVSNRDGLGREYKSQLTSDPDGTDTVDTTFDLLGRKASISNPYRSGDTTYRTAYQYDALNRITLEIPPDGSISTNNVATGYDAQITGTLCLTTTVTDQASKSRKSCTDALGRLVEVFEDPSLLNYETDYGYDVLNNLISVTQKGDNATNARTRTFIYDSLSRLTSVANPESGTITYSYTNGTALCAGDISAVCSKTAPQPNQSSGTVTTTYTYDVLNRLTGKTYSDTSTLPVAFGYDQSHITMGTTGFDITNSIGRLSWDCTLGNNTCPAMHAFSYDAMGRTGGAWETADDGTTVQKFVYTYNLDGSPATLTYPSGRILTYTVKGAGRVTDVKDVANGVNYATGATYAPPGELATVINGTSSVGITVTDSYNKRLQPSVLTVATNGSGTHTIFSRTYDFQLGTTDNGVVYQIANGLDGNRTQNFTYDTLNRILTAQTTNWGEQYTTDAWGNLTNIGACCGKTNQETLNAAPATTQNYLTGFGYDIAGNLTSNGSSTFIYDDENRLTNTAGYTYTYDAHGRRVTKMGGATPREWSTCTGREGTHWPKPTAAAPC